MTMSFAAQNAIAQIETLVMPGDVIEGHAEYETECSHCHLAFRRADQRALCLDCHEDVATDVDAGHGYHGRDPNAQDTDCATCHTDHEGRDADIVQLDENTFDHDFTDFVLAGKHLEAECDACHEAGSKHRDAPSQCFDCHEDVNPHHESLGTDCAGCHSPAGWPEVEFDHDATDFPLVGKHRENTCISCHAERQFHDMATNCYSCHAENDAHEGRSGQQCESCHSPTGWTDTKFNHGRDTRFALTGSHAMAECGDCHSEDPFADELDVACVSCHLENDNHEGHFGGTCETCHVPEEWAAIRFDHATDTGRALNGAHAEAECTACHVEPVFEVKPANNCLSCHEDDDAHAGTQGEQCLDCHNEIAWAENVFFDHDLTRFPRLGKHAEADCDACHETHVFEEAPTECRECHAEVDPHAGRFPDTCGLCHNPVDWLQWQFDHDTQSDFELTGAHRDVPCQTCHRRPIAAQMRLGSRCADCHRSDDVHDGEFGFDCGRCHSADSFTEVRSVQ
jgi:hypothetical protein